MLASTASGIAPRDDGEHGDRAVVLVAVDVRDQEARPTDSAAATSTEMPNAQRSARPLSATAPSSAVALKAERKAIENRPTAPVTKNAWRDASE